MKTNNAISTRNHIMALITAIAILTAIAAECPNRWAVAFTHLTRSDACPDFSCAILLYTLNDVWFNAECDDLNGWRCVPVGELITVDVTPQYYGCLWDESLQKWTCKGELTLGETYTADKQRHESAMCEGS